MCSLRGARSISRGACCVSTIACRLEPRGMGGAGGGSMGSHGLRLAGIALLVLGRVELRLSHMPVHRTNDHPLRLQIRPHLLELQSSHFLRHRRVT
eukprot:455406-Pyramimonas_sp.AAC.1